MLTRHGASIRLEMQLPESAYAPRGFAAGDNNLYRYVGNAPTNATDPSGLTVTFKSITLEDKAGARSMVALKYGEVLSTLGAKADEKGNVGHAFQIRILADVSKDDDITNARITQYATVTSFLIDKKGKKFYRENGKEITASEFGTSLSSWTAYLEMLEGNPRDNKRHEHIGNLLDIDGSFYVGLGGAFKKGADTPTVAASQDSIMWFDMPGWSEASKNKNALNPADWREVNLFGLFRIVVQDKKAEAGAIGKKIVAEFTLQIRATSDGKTWTNSTNQIWPPTRVWDKKV